jgi:hypothetical protein
MELSEVAATLRSYVSKSGALQGVAVIEDGVVTCDATGAVTIEREGDAEPELVEWRGAQAADLGMELKRLPPFDVDPVAGEVSGPLGALEHHALGVLHLARALGAGRVAIGVLPTLDETTLAISAREGEGVVVVVGDEQFEMEEGWPPERPAIPPT